MHHVCKRRRFRNHGALLLLLLLWLVVMVVVVVRGGLAIVPVSRWKVQQTHGSTQRFTKCCSAVATVGDVTCGKCQARGIAASLLRFVNCARQLSGQCLSCRESSKTKQNKQKGWGGRGVPRL